MSIGVRNGPLQYDRRSSTVHVTGPGSRDLDIGLDGPGGPSMETEMYRDFFRSIREGSQLTLIMDFAIETTKIDYSAWTIIDERRIVPDVDFM